MPPSPLIKVHDLIGLLVQLPEGAEVTALTRANTGNLAVVVDNKDWGYVDMRTGELRQYQLPTLH